MWSVQMGILGCVCVCKHLPGWFWGTFLSMSKWQEGVRTLDRAVCALFSSIWQCQKTSKEGYHFTNLRIVYLMHNMHRIYSLLKECMQEWEWVKGCM